MENINISAVNVTTSEVPTLNLIYELGFFVGGFSFLVGFPTHSYVTWLIVSGAGNGVPSEIFNLNLSVCEIGVCLYSLFFLLSVWASSLILVKDFLVGFAITGRSLFQCLMCVERYLAVVHPVIFLKTKPLRYRVIFCAVAWIITLVSCLYRVLILASCSEAVVGSWWFFLQFFVFLFIQLFFLAAVLRALKKSGPGEGNKEENHMKRRAFFLILIITSSTVVIYVPNAGLGLVSLMTQQENKDLWLVGMACFLLAGFVSPVLFLHRTGKLSFPVKM